MDWTTTQLTEKIVRAKVKLESISSREHSAACPTNDDTGHAPCNCGADKHNSDIRAAINELSLD